MFIFGYGSLVWKVDFPYKYKRPAYISGFVRRFWQGSNDHRGSPESPGLVTTLIPLHIYNSKFKQVDPNKADHLTKTYGVLYKIDDIDIDRVTNHLDYREKNGYQKIVISVYCPTKNGNIDIVKDVLVYIATHDNEMFIGPQGPDLTKIATQILQTTGPSGLNRDYLEGMALSLRILTQDRDSDRDDHIEDLMVYFDKAERIKLKDERGSIKPEDLDDLKAMMSLHI